MLPLMLVHCSVTTLQKEKAIFWRGAGGKGILVARNKVKWF